MTAPAPFTGLSMFGYSIIHADPAWLFANYSEKGEGRNPNQHYDCMSIEEIEALPVGELAAGDCALFLWVTDPLLPEGLRVMRSWGFRYVTVAFTWAKRTKRDEGWHMGTGYYTRANPEMCLLGVTGRMSRASAAVRQLIVAPLREHSRKPDEVYTGIEQLFGDQRRVDLFSRQRRAGWDSWGNQTDKFEGAT